MIALSGNALVVTATTCIILAVTWGGITHSWASAAVLVPFLAGFLMLGAFFWYEFRFPDFPIVSHRLILI